MQNSDNMMTEKRELNEKDKNLFAQMEGQYQSENERIFFETMKYKEQYENAYAYGWDVLLDEHFGGQGSHLYEDQLGWQYETKQEYKSNVSRVLFETIVIELWYNFSFYYVDNDTLYGFHMEGNPVCFKKITTEKKRTVHRMAIGS